MNKDNELIWESYVQKEAIDLPKTIDRVKQMRDHDTDMSDDERIMIDDFIKSLEVSLEQLKFTTNNGLAAGLSKTIIENMNKLSLYERPMHCTDTKRETLYIKEEDKWTKDDNKEKIKDAIKKASNKNYNALQEWKVKNPDFTNDDLKQEYFSNVISTIGKTSEQIDTKIIKNLCKETYIKK